MFEKKEPEASGGAPEWMCTYGDMVTLLLCFFVLLFSFSTVDAKKWEMVVQSFASSPSIVILDVLDPSKDVITGVKPLDPDNNSNDEDKADLEKNVAEEKSKEEFKELLEQIKASVSANNLDALLQVLKDNDTIILRFTEGVLFDAGSADLKTDKLGILDSIGKILDGSADNIGQISIEGHTDNRPIHTAQFPSNFSLSNARAYNTLDYLSKKGVDPTKMNCGGYGEYHPIDTNDSDDGRAHNRRVDIVIERRVD